MDENLNIHRKKDNFWHTFRVTLDKKGTTLNLSNPQDYLSYLVLRANKLYIAPNGSRMGSRATFRFGMMEEDYEANKTASKADRKMEAYMALGVLREAGKEGMLDFLRIYGQSKNKAGKISKTSRYFSRQKLVRSS